jgi:hypothetical protein
MRGLVLLALSLTACNTVTGPNAEQLCTSGTFTQDGKRDSSYSVPCVQ